MENGEMELFELLREIAADQPAPDAILPRLKNWLRPATGRQPQDWVLALRIKLINDVHGEGLQTPIKYIEWLNNIGGPPTYNSARLAAYRNHQWIRDALAESSPSCRGAKPKPATQAVRDAILKDLERGFINNNRFYLDIWVGENPDGNEETGRVAVWRELNRIRNMNPTAPQIPGNVGGHRPTLLWRDR